MEKLLRTHVGFGNVERVKDKNTRLWFEGNGWVLRVSDAGNNFMFQKERNTPVTPLALKARPEKAMIFSEGKAVITTVLADVVKLGPKEQLVELDIVYEKSSAQTKSGQTMPTVVEGWTAVFGRAVDGNLVVGGGSHVAVSFDASGMLEALDVDWPEYSNLGITATAAGLDVVVKRGKDKEKMLLNNEARVEKKMECGYLDLGGRHATKRIERLQLGCMRTLESHNSTLAPGNSEKWVTVQAIQAAVNPIAERAMQAAVNPITTSRWRQ